ncbi:lipase family alpha/beta hydrolase [Haliangium sp.]|uniref:lipase family alpha/beta hydrolase n=1 Tax=Haliangium sp. TaxID=2663208 RepID=UPI003D11BB4F
MKTPWLVRWLTAAPARWLGRSSAVHQDIASGSQGLSYLRHLVRGNRLRRRATFERVAEDTRPVLVIHGFLGTRGSMLPLEHHLAEDGFCVFSFNLGPLNIRDIRRSAFLIHRKIERILSQTSWQEIDIVAHSMGGLIALYYIKKLGGHSRVRTLISLGTPYRGTWVALAGVATMGLLSTSSWQLLPRSRFLDDLHRGPIPEGVEVYSIAAARDWLCPPKATRMRGVKAITVPFGHSGLVVSPDVYERVKGILRPTDRLGTHDREQRVDPTSDALAQPRPGTVTSPSLTSRRGDENA